MLTSLQKQERRAKRTRHQLKKGANGRPRLSVCRSLKHISAQIIDDKNGRTLAAASTLEAEFRKSGKTGGNCDAATIVGTQIAQRAVKAGIEQLVFDRGGCIYHGRVRALADAARAGGLKF